MNPLQSLLGALDERTIASEIAVPHDEARVRYWNLSIARRPPLFRRSSSIEQLRSLYARCQRQRSWSVERSCYEIRPRTRGVGRTRRSVWWPGLRRM